MKKRTVINIIYIVYLLLLLAYIFGNSLVCKEESSRQSGALVTAVNNFLKSANISFSITDYFIRKFAHFCEFFVLGASLYGFCLLNGKVNLTNVIFCAFAACLTAITDETIQVFTNRGSMLVDVWLDFLSACAAIAVFCLIHILRTRRKRTKANASEQTG